MKKLNCIFPLAILLGAVLGCGETQKKPEWQRARVLAENLDHPSAITTDETHLYFVTGGTIASLNAGTSGVWKMPLAGGEPTQLFKGFQKDERTVILPETFVLAIDEKYVYWSSGTIWRTPKAGGESEHITGGMPTEFALDDEKIYWHNFGGEHSPPTPIYSADKAGSEAKAITEPVITSGIVVDGEFLYWAQSDGIYKTLKSGGEKSKIYSAPEKQWISGLVSDADNFYFTQGNGRNALLRISRRGGEPEKIAASINHANKFYVDETHVYFVTNESSFSTALVKVPKTGGEVVKLDVGHSASFAVGKSQIFVTDVSKIYALDK